MSKGEQNKKALPLGMGYKSCWMVVEGATQKEVAGSLLQERRMKYEYKAGLEKVAKAKQKENKMLVTSVYKKQSYVIGDSVSQFFYDTEEFLAKCKNFSKVYVYMTHRVSETHGFALVENGNLVRLFCYDENDIQNIGEPLPEEMELGYHLPTTFEEVRSDEYTTVDEDMIVALAVQQVGIDVDAYPYKDVRVGKRFEYSTELAADPYPETWPDFDIDEDFMIADEIQNLPVVQRFTKAKSSKERLAIVTEAKDELTHDIINAFGLLMVAFPSYGRLSSRIDELDCILKSSIQYEEKVLSQKELYKELEKGKSTFEDKIFEGLLLQEIECETLYFKNCMFNAKECFIMKDIYCDSMVFENCSFKGEIRFEEHKIEGIEMYQCHFSHATISGNLENALLFCEECTFDFCKIKNFTLNGYVEQSELIDCKFLHCHFSDILIHADLTISGGYYSVDATNLDFHMNGIFHAEIRSNVNNIKFHAALIKNKFILTNIENLEIIDIGEEPAMRDNIFENCCINGVERGC